MLCPAVWRVRVDRLIVSRYQGALSMGSVDHRHRRIEGHAGLYGGHCGPDSGDQMELCKLLTGAAGPLTDFRPYFR